MNVISPETRMMGLPYGEEIMIVGGTMWTQSTSVTDGQTDGQNYDRVCNAERRTVIIIAVGYMHLHCMIISYDEYICTSSVYVVYKF